MTHRPVMPSTGHDSSEPRESNDSASNKNPISVTKKRGIWCGRQRADLDREHAANAGWVRVPPVPEQRLHAIGGESTGGGRVISEIPGTVHSIPIQ